MAGPLQELVIKCLKCPTRISQDRIDVQVRVCFKNSLFPGLVNLAEIVHGLLYCQAMVVSREHLENWHVRHPVGNAQLDSVS